MTAVEGGSVACFVVRVLETLQYLDRKRDITSLFFLPVGVVSRSKNFSQSPQDFARCVWQKSRCWQSQMQGTPQYWGGCGPDLTVGATLSADFLNSRCGWGNRDLSIEMAPGGSDVAHIKLH